MRKILSRSLLGLILVAIGAGYLGNYLGLWSDFTIFFDGWWAIFFIVFPAVLSMISDGVNQGNIILSLVGIILYLSQIKVFEGTSAWKIILCVAVIVIGLGIIIKPAVRPKKDRRHTHYVNDSGAEKQSVSFGSSTYDFNGREFSGGDYSVSFGELVLDLSGAVIEHDCEIAIHVAFGSMELRLPNNVGFVNHSGAVFGGVEIKHRQPVDPNYPKLILSGNCVFGGVEVK